MQLRQFLLKTRQFGYIWYAISSKIWQNIANLAIFGKIAPIWRLAIFGEIAPIWRFSSEIWRNISNLAIFGEIAPIWRFSGDTSRENKFDSPIIYTNFLSVSRHKDTFGISKNEHRCFAHSRSIGVKKKFISFTLVSTRRSHFRKICYWAKKLIFFHIQRQKIFSGGYNEL